jgi:hypothetical protein
MFNWLGHRFESIEPCAYVCYDIQAPINYIAKAALTMIEKEPIRYTGYSMTEIMAKAVEDCRWTGENPPPDWDDMTAGGSSKEPCFPIDRQDEVETITIETTPELEDGQLVEEDDDSDVVIDLDPTTLIFSSSEEEVSRRESQRLTGARQKQLPPAVSHNDCLRGRPRQRVRAELIPVPEIGPRRPQPAAQRREVKREEVASSSGPSSSSGGPTTAKKAREDHLGDAQKQFHHAPVLSCCFKCGEKGHSKFSGYCKNLQLSCEYCHSVTHATVACRELHAGCTICEYRGHRDDQHDNDIDGKPLPRDAKIDWQRFRKCQDQGFYTRRRERFPSFGFWIFPQVLLDVVGNVSCDVLYNHGWEDAKKRITAMAEGKVHPDKYSVMGFMSGPKKSPIVPPAHLKRLDEQRKKYYREKR